MRINRVFLLKIFVFSAIFIIGYSFYTSSFSSNQVRSSVTTGIIAGKYPHQIEKMVVNYFLMDIDTQKQIVYLTFDITYYDKGNYSVLLTLLYRISSYDILEAGKWDIKNAESGSIVMVTFEAENVTMGWDSQRLRIKLYTQDLVVDKIFETNSIRLPFGGSITLDIQDKLDEIRENSPITIIGCGFNGTLRLTLPHSAIITGTTIDVDRRDPEKDFQVLQFRINDFKPFQLQYLDSEQRKNFERNILISGTLFGVAASGFAEVIIGLISAKYNTEDKETTSGGTKISNNDNDGKDEKSPEDKILSLIRLIDSKKKKLFKPYDVFYGWTSLLLILAMMYVFFEPIILFSVPTLPEKATLILSLIAVVIALLALFVPFAKGSIIDKNFRRLENQVEENEKPLLKALLKIKGENLDFDLEQIYNMNPDMFAQKKLLEKLYD